MFDDDFFKKTSEALNGFFDSIEKGIKGLQNEVDSTKDKMMKQAEESAKNAEAAKTDADKTGTAAGEAKGEKDAAGGNDADKKNANPIGDWFNKILDGGSKNAVGEKGIAYYRADTADTVNIFCEVSGCDKTSVNVKYEKDMLIVRAKKNLPEVEGTVLFKEAVGVRAGELEQKIRVGKLDQTSIHAGYKNGILTITCKRPQV